MKTLKSMRLHIGIFGKMNVGKSSFLNRVTNQDVSIVSDIAGTTTDVVEKSMELLPVGPVNFLDTAGINDMSALGAERIEKTMKIINRTDAAVIICEADGIDDYERNLIEKFKTLEIPFCIIVNKTDIKPADESVLNELKTLSGNILTTSFLMDKDFVFNFKKLLVKILPDDFVNSPNLIKDILPAESTAVLVIPVDKEAPKGRIILPQVQTLRELLDNRCISIVSTEKDLADALNKLKTPPDIVITDSQAFRMVSEIVPQEVYLTSFSILFARMKGDLDVFTAGAEAVSKLCDGDRVLILESCTHHPVEDDIGRVKIPKLLRQKTGKNLIIDNISGHDFPDITGYKLIIHCGACMTNRKEVLSRILLANNAGIPITNYGIVISYCLGILPRAMKIFTDSRVTQR